MIYYIYKENKVYGSTVNKDLISDIALINNLEDYQIGTTEFSDYTPNNIKYVFKNGEIAINPNYEEEKIQEEKERIAMLSLTRGDVFRGLLLAKNVTRADIRAMIENNEMLTMLQKEMALIDFDEALNFYRGNSLIDVIGSTLGITTEQLDQFFETNDYKALVSEVFNLNE